MPDEWVTIEATKADYTSRGRHGVQWYRMSRDGIYLGKSLEAISRAIRTRQQVSYAMVKIGAIVMQHAPGGPISRIYLVVADDDDVLCECRFRRRSGHLIVTLPDDSTVTIHDPRH